MSSIPRGLSALLVVLTLALAAAPAQAAFPGANGQLAFEDSGQIVAMNPDGTGRRVLTTGGDPAWSPNGRQIAFHLESRIACGFASSMSVWEIRVINADGTGLRTVTRGNRNNCGSGAAQPAWSPDGQRLAFVDGAGGEGANDGANIEGGGRSLFTVPLNGGSPTRVTTGLRVVGRPAWSPDGTRIALEGESQQAPGNEDIYTVSPTGTSLARLTTNGRDDFAPTWSPDSRRIAFTSERDDNALGFVCDGDAGRDCNTEIYTMARDGTGIARLTFRGPETKDSYANYSPDGTQLVFTSNRFESSAATTPSRAPLAMRVHRMTTTGVVTGTLFDGINPDWQPAPTAVPLTAGLGTFAVRDEQAFFRGDETTAVMEVHLTERAPLGGATVTLSSDDPAHATAPATVTVPAGAETVNVNIALHAPTGSLSVFPTITATYRGRSVAQQIEILPRAALSLLFLGNVRADGNNARVDLTAPAPAGGAVVSLSSSNPALAPVPATMTVPEGTAQGFFPLFVRSAPATPTTITITATYNGVSKTDSATLNPDPKVASVTLSPTSVVGGAVGTGFSTVTVTLDRPVSNDVPFQSPSLVVSMASSDPHARVAGDIHVFPGGTTGSITVNTDPVTATTTANISATAGGVTKSAPLTIRPGTPIPPAQPDVATYTVTPNTVANGGTVQGRVTLTGPAPTGGTTVSFTEGDPAVAIVPDQVVPAGQTAISFPVTAQFTSPVNVTGTLIARTVTGTGLGAPVSTTLTVTPVADPPAPPPPGDTVRVTRAGYDSQKRELRVEATSTSTTATLTAFNNGTGARIGALQNSGGGQYRGQFTNVANPGTVRVTSSLGGTGTLAVSSGSGTVRPAVPAGSTAGGGLVTPAARVLLHASSEVALGAADPSDVAAPTLSALRVLPNRIRVASRRGALVSFTLGEPARVRVSLARLAGGRAIPVRGALERTLPAGRVRVRFRGLLGGRRLQTGVYGVVVDAVDASGNRAASRRAVVTLRPAV